MSEHILEVRNLRVHFHNENSIVKAVDGISYKLEKGKILGIVGESGSGKSISCLSILALIRDRAEIESSGTIMFNSDDENVNLRDLTGGQLQKIRGSKISMIFQEPANSLNPVHTCGKQVLEVLQIHSISEKLSHKQRVLELFEQVPNLSSCPKDNCMY